MEMKRINRIVLPGLISILLCGCTQKIPADAARNIGKLNRILLEESLPVMGAPKGVRMMHVKDFTQIQALLKELCTGAKVGLKVKANHIFFTYELADRCSYLLLTNDVGTNGDEIARLRVDLRGTGAAVREIRFFRN